MLYKSYGGAYVLAMNIHIIETSQDNTANTDSSPHRSKPSTKSKVDPSSPQTRGATSSTNSHVVIGSPLKSTNGTRRDISQAPKSSEEAKSPKLPPKKKVAQKKVSKNISNSIALRLFTTIT